MEATSAAGRPGDSEGRSWPGGCGWKSGRQGLAGWSQGGLPQEHWGRLSPGWEEEIGLKRGKAAPVVGVEGGGGQ